jgi:hypothetical protein
VESKKAAGAAAGGVEHEPTIEEVSAKQLEKILLDKDYVAVYWCKCGTIPCNIIIIVYTLCVFICVRVFILNGA